MERRKKGKEEKWRGKQRRGDRIRRGLEREEGRESHKGGEMGQK